MLSIEYLTTHFPFGLGLKTLDFKLIARGFPLIFFIIFRGFLGAKLSMFWIDSIDNNFTCFSLLVFKKLGNALSSKFALDFIIEIKSFISASSIIFVRIRYANSVCQPFNVFNQSVMFF